jgi:dolichol-phosphate mannosyltransferase
MPKTYVIIPTYNEAENIESLLKEILNLNIPDLTATVVDDNSPDGTGKIADYLADKNPSIKVIHRYQDRGRGSAGIEGFKFALKAGADNIIEMDADFSHHPKYIPALLEQIKRYDVVIGSRFVKGGRDSDRGLTRKLTTFLARNYIRWILGTKVKDPTSGYRCFKKKVLEKIDLDHLLSTGPSIVEEILYKALLNKFSIFETPIAFEDRKKGETKLSFAILIKTLFMIYKFKKLYK